MNPAIINAVWRTACAPSAALFARALHQVEEVQRRKLAAILRRNRNTRYGLRYGFQNIRTVEDYQTRVPLVSYEELTPFVSAVAEGEPDVLTPGLPMLFEPTSGSMSASKLIPYTRALKTEFQAAIAPWIFDLLQHHPAVRRGRAYWSISPRTDRPRQTPGGISIGFDEDGAYLHPLLRHLLPQVMAVPGDVARITDRDAFRYVTLAFLLRCHDLALVSVWNPTYLSLLIAPLRNWGDRLAADLSTGTLSPPGGTPPELLSILSRQLEPHPRRAREVSRHLEQASGDADLHHRLWPNLTCISCWADATARGPAEALHRIFPQAIIAPKGLLSTEGVVSIPMSGCSAPALAVRSHFFEFVETSPPGRVFTTWQLRTGIEYSIVLTTGGGLYRYRTHDIVRVTGYLAGCPLLEFLGRGNRVSDLYGEKLHERHVASVLEKLWAGAKWRPGFAVLVPDGTPEADHYALFLADESPLPDGILPGLRMQLENELRTNFHYDYCRKIGQLQEANIQWIPGGSNHAWRTYLQSLPSQNQPLGGIKPFILISGKEGHKLGKILRDTSMVL
ncbi:MAG: GH3 auxin-responsive promoter family protein [Planctomycetota bacterium]